MNKTLSYTRKILALHGYGKALQFFVCAQVYRESFAKWFDFIETDLSEVASDDFKIRLAFRAAFRFVNPQFSVPERIEALISHYTALIKSFPRSALSEFMAGCEIAEVTGQSGKKYIFKVTHNISKEGALTVVMIDTETETYSALAILTGIISLDRDRRPVFMIGMLRGPGRKLQDGKERISAATRDLNSLRPKQAVVHAASAVAQWFNAGEIIAPGTEKQIAIKSRGKGQKIVADYDAFWQEFAKEPAPDGSYHLPLPLARRDVADVQQKRRKDWKLRYEKIDAVSADIKKTLDGLADVKRGA
jgi:uncharacterized protein VirK/YbjX